MRWVGPSEERRAHIFGTRSATAAKNEVKLPFLDSVASTPAPHPPSSFFTNQTISIRIFTCALSSSKPDSQGQPSRPSSPSSPPKRNPILRPQPAPVILPPALQELATLLDLIHASPSFHAVRRLRR
ncbi:uncharacterized protein PAN0_002c1092 [Moesziomyces antarcticus]|uniref:Uncharacterized protein n=1 Tax=Pseudozyma antarctica TaxID=84753 RepID=A0A5C3FIP4_PSEA2|nr:uncharacterized protein PAN0_002c1092 [Moesziomyces antarcticus]GAK62890.1 hypothetical protein PAN0_002c1092 [Moesziomyces antarcticus]SPO43635.1 uncharacterized protein PSANT_01320 [Moesziomyces antarcticus]